MEPLKQEIASISVTRYVLAGLAAGCVGPFALLVVGLVVNVVHNDFSLVLSAPLLSTELAIFLFFILLVVNILVSIFPVFTLEFLRRKFGYGSILFYIVVFVAVYFLVTVSCPYLRKAMSHLPPLFAPLGAWVFWYFTARWARRHSVRCVKSPGP